MLEVDATNLPRFMACQGSRLMGASPSIAVADTKIRDEGNAVHYVVQAVCRKEFTVDELIDRKAPNGVYITSEMADHVHEYLALLDGKGDIEVSTDIVGNTFRINARADRIYLTDDNVLHIYDLKYGYSIVEPEMNWTLIAHAIGYCISRSVIPTNIVFGIFQPRAFHYEGNNRTWSIDYARLLELYNQLVTTLSNPSDELHTSQHCNKCRACATCPAARKAEMNAIDAAEMAFTDQIDNINLAFELDTINRAEAMLKNRKQALEEVAMFRISKGEVIENYGVENRLANRSWKKDFTVETLLALTGKDLSTPKLVTPAEAERRGVDDVTIKMLTDRLPIGIKLVRMSASKKAEKIFGKK